MKRQRILAWSCLSISVAMASANAQIGEAVYVNATIADVSNGIASGDLDADGNVDLVGVSDKSGRVVLFRGLGGGEFSTGSELIRGASLIGKPVVADLDFDGDLDVLVGEDDSQTPEDLLLLENQGGMGFQVTPIDLGPTAFLWRFQMHDYDADGDLDLLADAFFELNIHENLGGLNFAPPVTVYNAGADSVAQPVFADIDNNGRDDLVFMSFDSYFFEVDLLYMPQDLNGNFGPVTLIDAALGDTPTLVPIDLDSDGNLDIIYASNMLTWYRNDGMGALVKQTGALANIPGIEDVQLHDVDMDGDNDLVCAVRGPNPQADRRVLDLINHQNGTLSEGSEVGLTFWPPSFIAPADFNGDGRLDVAYTASFTAQLFWSSREVDGSYSDRKWITQRAGNDDFAAIDVNGDGLNDVVDLEVTQGEKTLSWFEQQVDGTFARGDITPISGFIPTGVEFVDLEGDGYGDVVFAVIGSGGAPGTILVYPGGPNGFEPPVTVTSHATQQQYQTPLPIDLDADGDLDLVSSGSGVVDIVSAYMNLGNGAWSAPQTVELLPISTPLSKEDFDGDGLMDMILVADFINSPTIYAYRNLGNGGFAPKVLVWNGSAYRDGVVGIDLDGDGDKELLRVEQSAGQTFVYWHENLGGLQFASPALLTELTPSNQFSDYVLSATDWDLDGLKDLVYLNEYFDLVQWSKNLGGQTFGTPTTLAEGFQYSRAFQVVDMDRDLDKDILVADDSQLATLLYENLSSVGDDVCSSQPNSTGLTSALNATGSFVASLNTISLSATQLPSNVFGFFLVGSDSGFVANPGGSDGNLCLGGSIGRYNQLDAIRFSGPLGAFSLELNLPQTPSPTGPVSVMAGQTWYFQCWHRDQTPGSSNLSNGLEIQFQ